MSGLTKEQRQRAKMLRGELTKVRCWLTGFQAGRGPEMRLGAGIPGEDAIRQTIMLIDELTGTTHDQ